VWWALHRGEPSGGERELTSWERSFAAGLRVPARRRDFVHGRWTVKHLVAALVEDAYGQAVDLDVIEVFRDADGVPHLRWHEPALADRAVSVSLSHRGGAVLAVAALGCIGIGADVEIIEPRSRGLVEDFFVAEEVAAVDAAADRHLMANTIWSAKEAVLKALHLGLSVDTRRVVCRAPEATVEWQEIGVDCWLADASRVRCFCRRQDDLVLTLAWTSPDPTAGFREHVIGAPQPACREGEVCA
jgi:4'-phosphopantetheinyl transferase